eukprot:2572528-Prorocentrum_lima.AAC.1
MLNHLGNECVRKRQVSTDADCSSRERATFANEMTSQSWSLSMSEPMEQLVSDEVCRGLPEARMLLWGCRQHQALPGP